MSRKPSLLATAMKPVERPAPAAAAPAASDTPAEPIRRARGAQSAGSYVAPSRANKTAKTHYLPPAYWETLEELSFRTRDPQGKRIPQERLVAEALNLLFVKYNYPVVHEGGE
ncbi:chromosome partitioning protein ParB [Aurantimonas sp. C2-6-R+9]|uniref:chromosome partitioning protein ParB n=1 Tax=unclassified Aurantimonas TaxID=2638230 RepID=UPI002E18096B|nr:MULTISPECIES: chromosome partitioning protein ParB [unclassified Aurantimonas]MEC5292283.1 chromosome partitioning protein ParB [Aurantimonas sp. C2-3-R2]MEC5382497.1 chromosome partitioning protein ParB [Aurantimonas sp. C2-6-R+9]MEC5413368.1 chromosome partitioning protein ParB [Aurantimonas sp. C2-4-R8]